MTMNLQQDLNQKASQCSVKDIAQFMGYQRKSAKKVVKRLEYLLSDEHLGLNDGIYDFKYSNKQFLNKICNLLDIDINQYQGSLEEIEKSMELKTKGFKSYVFVDTKFKRKNEPVFILSVCEKYRHIAIDWSVRKLTFEDQIPLISNIIKIHYEKTGGILKVWGDIKQYAFFYADGENVVFKPNGEIFENQPEVKLNKAVSQISNLIKT